MGLFDELAGGLLKQVFSSPGTQKALLEMVMGLLKGSESGGLEGMTQKFNANGLGDIMSSWVSKGENLPISPEQILQVFGSGQVQQIGERLGVSSGEASGGIADILPQIVDKLTPDGSLPSEDLLDQGLREITGKLFGK